tara:strand:- start:742 stop:993 length:252 start_codon:yes stop_codon:yes gene_type:complete
MGDTPVIADQINKILKATLPVIEGAQENKAQYSKVANELNLQATLDTLSSSLDLTQGGRRKKSRRKSKKRRKKTKKRRRRRRR